jgi:hypothetical protein
LERDIAIEAPAKATSQKMKPTFFCGESILQLQTLATKWGWNRINMGWGWRTPGGAEVRHTRGREQLRGFRGAVLLVAPFEAASSYHAGRIEEIVAAARGQGFDVRRVDGSAVCPLVVGPAI